MLRWHIQRGNIVFPKSTTRSRGKENFQIFDFQLESDAVARIDALDQGEPGRIVATSDTFAFIPE